MDVPTDQRRGAARATSSTVAWIVAICTVGYMLPWAIAATRGAANSAQVFWLNLLLGWTFVGWVIALVMAFRAHRQTAVVVVQQPMSAPPPTAIPAAPTPDPLAPSPSVAASPPVSAQVPPPTSPSAPPSPATPNDAESAESSARVPDEVAPPEPPPGT